MIRDNTGIHFTEDDKKNLCVKKYSTKELSNNILDFKNKRNKRRIIFFSITAVLVVLRFILENLRYADDLAICFMVFLIILYECIDHINFKAMKREYYIELKIEELLPTETTVDGTHTPGSDISFYYPVNGADTTNGYKCLYYIEKEQYNIAKIGDVVRISVNQEII